MSAPNELTFVLASCQYPAGLLDQTIAEASFGRLKKRLRHSASRAMPKRLLLVGDMIYADATAGLFDPTAQFDRYNRRYQDLQATPAFHHVKAAFQKLNGPLEPWSLVMLDDHEIEDNWEPIEGDDTPRKTLAEARDAYFQYFGCFNPPPTGDGQSLWFPIQIEGFPFFMADTRTERSPRTAKNVDRAEIMSEKQFQALLEWLNTHAKVDLPKFIASPAILLPRRLRATLGSHPASALRSDAWDGYPRSLHRLLAHIADRNIRNVVFLSGDEHLSCVASAWLRSPKSPEPTLIVSVHSSALYAPFPFANSLPEDLAGDETFQFRQDNDEYSCRVETQFGAPGDGFAVLRTLKDPVSGKWKLCCRFDRNHRVSVAPRRIHRLLS